MSVPRDLRDAIVLAVAEVPNAGMVQDHAVYSSNWDTYLSQFSSIIDGRRQIRGWWLSIPTISTPIGRETTFYEAADRLNYILRGILGVSESYDSEEEFENLIYDVRDNLRNRTHWGLGPTVVIPNSTTVILPVVEHRQFGSVLCHYCEMIIGVTINVQVDWADEQIP